MKNILHFFLILPLLCGCNKDNDDVTILSSYPWSFEVTLNGVTHKAQGSIDPQFPASGNSAYCVTSTGAWPVVLQISDPSSNSYISGDLGDLYLFFENPSVGICEVDLGLGAVSSSWFSTAVSSIFPNLDNIPAYSTTYGYEFTGQEDPDTFFKIPFMITDLGSPANGTLGSSAFIPGESFKANYNGTLYIPDLDAESLICTIPLEVDIQFEASRF